RGGARPADARQAPRHRRARRAPRGGPRAARRGARRVRRPLRLDACALSARRLAHSRRPAVLGAPLAAPAWREALGAPALRGSLARRRRPRPAPSARRARLAALALAPGRNARAALAALAL